MKQNRRWLSVLLSLVLVLSLTAALSGCGKEAAAPALSGAAIEHEPEFGGVYITSTIDDFNALGFAYGDSVNVTFSNGYTAEDLPYYNGYYTRNGEALLVAYPGYPYIKAAINNGDDFWEIAGLSAGDTAEITLAARGKYLAIQNARDIHYTDAREDYDSDVIFANFRSVDAAGIAPDRLFRSASPCDNQHNRAAYVDALMQEAGVRFILNLSDNEEKIAGYMSSPDFSCETFRALLKAGQVAPIALNANYGSQAFREKLAAGLAVMAQQEGPYLVHCTEGKDRTGFICMLIEALAGASYQEIEDDYMKTYDNYYKITEEKDKKKYDIILEMNLDAMIKAVVGDEKVDIKKADLKQYARNYLIGGGMPQNKADQFISMISR